MLLPYLAEAESASKKYTVAFRGLNYGEGYQDGEMAECTNLSTERYPCISPRAERVSQGVFHNPGGIQVKDGIVIATNAMVYFKKGPVAWQVGTITEGRKQMAAIGNYVVIFPDKAYYNVVTEEFGSLENTYKGTGLKFTHNTISGFSTAHGFRDGDAVTISGCTTTENNKSIIIRSLTSDTITFKDNSFTAVTETAEVTIKRKVPDLDFICESNYRLWGTKGNTIFASKFSDPFNFEVFDGLADDSYNIDVGSDGDFTGCIPYSSHICFFKENTLHKLYGTKPSNFQIVTANVYGVQQGCERSMCIVNEQLLYKGVDGIYSYAGGVPELISSKFGMKRFSEAAATCDGERYYISMKSGDEWGLYVYDVLKNIWVREDDKHACDMAFYDGHVYIIDTDGHMEKIDRNLGREDVEWSATFCPFNETVNEKKGYSKFHLRLDLGEGSRIMVDVKTDNDTQWKEVYKTFNDKARTVSIPIIPTRCDSVSVRLRGKGECTVKTFIREFITRSDK